MEVPDRAQHKLGWLFLSSTDKQNPHTLECANVDGTRVVQGLKT